MKAAGCVVHLRASCSTLGLASYAGCVHHLPQRSLSAHGRQQLNVRSGMLGWLWSPYKEFVVRRGRAAYSAPHAAEAAAAAAEGYYATSVAADG